MACPINKFNSPHSRSITGRSGTYPVSICSLINDWGGILLRWVIVLLVTTVLSGHGPFCSLAVFFIADLTNPYVPCWKMQGTSFIN